MFLLVSVLNMMSYIQKVSSFKATVRMPPITTAKFMVGGFYEGPKKTPSIVTFPTAPADLAEKMFTSCGFYEGPKKTMSSIVSQPKFAKTGSAEESPRTTSVMEGDTMFTGSGFYMGPKKTLSPNVGCVVTETMIASIVSPPTMLTRMKADAGGGFYTGPSKSALLLLSAPLYQPPSTLPAVVKTMKIAFSGFYTGPSKSASLLLSAPLYQPPSTLPAVVKTMKIAFSGFYTGPTKQ